MPLNFIGGQLFTPLFKLTELNEICGVQFSMLRNYCKTKTTLAGITPS